MSPRPARKPVPPVPAPPPSTIDVRAAYRYVVRGNEPAEVHVHGKPGQPMTAFEVWCFLMDIPDAEQPVVAELLTETGPKRFEVRGAYAADGIGEVVIELIERRV